ncbi:MAG: hypothetical protein L0099_14800 [Acidobacteria bacterium]|nr:hypothetical protein [Acidobacteriota bacterium]
MFGRLLTLTVILLAVGFGLSPADESASGYTPVSPPRALHAALQINLKIVQDWLNEKDYTSAAQTAQGLIVLAQLHGYQSADPDWQKRTKALAEASGRLLAAARKKDTAGCEKNVRECTALLDELAKHPPAGPKMTVKNFAPFGSTKTWMLLMDGAYVDAKSARKAEELEELALALAETLNVSSRSYSR